MTDAETGGPTRLVSFLGMGRLHSEPPHYDPARYSWLGQESRETALVERALCDLEQIDSVVVLGTAEVRRRWIATGLLEQELGRSCEFVTVPDGANEKELWTVFESMRQALSHEALPGERSAPSRIFVDVTHGFRVQPMLGIAAVNFALSEWARLGIERPPEVRIVYGAWDARDKERGVAPIWDLTSFLSVGRWNAAIDAFMRYGRADDFERLAQAESATLRQEAQRRGLSGKDLAPLNYGRDLGRAAREFADALSIARFRDLLTETWGTGNKQRKGTAAALRAALDDPRHEALLARLPLLREPMGRLRDWTQRLIAPALNEASGRRALAELALVCGETERYSEQVAVVREGIIDHFAEVIGRPIQRAPGEAGYDAERQDLERLLERCGSAAREAKRADRETPMETHVRAALAAMGLPDGAAAIATVIFASETVEPRNDIHHGGLREKPLDAASLRKTLGQLATRFSELVGGYRA